MSGRHGFRSRHRHGGQRPSHRQSGRYHPPNGGDLYGGQLSIEPLMAPDFTEGMVGAGHIQPGIIDLDLFASTIRAPSVVDTLPVLADAAYPEGALVFLTSDGKLYRNVADVWTAAVDGADLIANSVTAGQIAAGAIGTTELAADAVIANVANVGGTVQIDETGILIQQGALTFLDNWGSSVLNGGGFGGAWIPFIHAGVYNAGFTAGEDVVEAPTSEVGGADTESEYQASLSDVIPYWVIGENSGYGNADDHLMIAAEPQSPTGRIMFAQGRANRRHYWYQDMPVVPGQIYAVRALDQWGSQNAASLSLGYSYSWRDVDRAIIGSEVSQSVLDSSSFPSAFTERTVVGNLMAPAGARYLRFGFDMTHIGAGALDLSLYVLAYVRLSQMQEAFNVLGIERRGLTADVFRIYYQGDQYGSFAIDEDGLMQWGAGGSTPPDVSISRTAAGVMTTPSVLEFVEQSGSVPLAQANGARLYARDNGAGKTQLAVRFQSGGSVVLATEP